MKLIDILKKDPRVEYIRIMVRKDTPVVTATMRESKGELLIGEPGFILPILVHLVMNPEVREVVLGLHEKDRTLLNIISVAAIAGGAPDANVLNTIDPDVQTVAEVLAAQERGLAKFKDQTARRF